MRYFLLALSLICFYFAFPQSQTDLIFAEINRANNATERLQAITSLTDHYTDIHRDSLDKYAYEAKQLAANQSNTLLKAKSDLLMAQDYFRWGWADSCNHTINEALKYTKLENPELRPVYFELKRLKALNYGGQNNYTGALDILYELIQEAETYQDYFTLGINSNTIGSIALVRGDGNEAEKWIRRGLTYTALTPEPILPASCYANLAMLFLRENRNDSALFYIEKAIPLSKKSGNIHVICTSLNIYSTVALNTGRTKLAENALQEIIEYRTNLGEEELKMDDRLKLIDFYIQTKQINKAIDLCLESLKTGNLNQYDSSTGIQSYTNNITNRLSYYEKLAECYKILGNTSAYSDVLENIIQAKDTLYKWNTENALAEMQTKYDVQQKEKTILTQRINLVRRGIIATISITTLLIAVAVFVLLIYRNRRRHKMRVAEAEEKERQRIAGELHDNLGVQANAILYTSEKLKSNPEQSEELSHNLNFTAKEMLFILRETLWALKSTQTDGTHLWMRIIGFADQMSRTYGTIKIRTEGEAPEKLKLSSAHALNLLMIVQEAVHNAIKHSQADTIVIESVPESGLWVLKVTDNGIGFDKEKAKQYSEGYGIGNMNQRAEDAKVELEINAEAGKGTEVKIVMQR